MRKKSEDALTRKGWYKTYWGMRNRCENPNVSSYKYYGGRGISVCEEWHDPRAFGKWAEENGYEQGLSIERIDVNKGYCPSNCKWIPRNEQGFNRSDSVKTTRDGITKTRKQWESEGVGFCNINLRTDEITLKRLREEAKEKGCTVNNLIIEILSYYVRKEKDK